MTERPAKTVHPRLVDLTRPLSAETPVFPGDPPVRLRGVARHEEHGYQVTEICLGSHAGTHLDAPRHFFPGGPPLSDYPLERLVGPGTVIDVRTGANGGAIHIDRLAHGLHSQPVRPGDRLLLWTGGGGILSPEAAHLLMSSGVGLVGTDSPSLDDADDYPIHRLLLGADILIAENLCNLDRLGAGSIHCAFLPLAVQDTDGAPVRAIAWR